MIPLVTGVEGPVEVMSLVVGMGVEVMVISCRSGGL